MSAALKQDSGSSWTAAHGDCVELMRAMPERSVHLTVTSIPFASLFTYSASDRDFGNCRSHEEFFAQFRFWVEELYRVTMPGRIAAIHCMILPTSKARDGVIGLTDFRGDVVRAMQAGGWVFHSETAIRKDPVVAMQRTKALGLLHKQIKKDSCMSRTGILDYLVAFRRPGENPEPVSHTDETYPVSKWQQVAEPVWLDIEQGDTLNVREAREHADERHLCALQKTVIERCIELWSNPGDVVLDPFGGIGSTGVIAIRMQRRAVVCELKESYYAQAVRNLSSAAPTVSLAYMSGDTEPAPANESVDLEPGDEMRALKEELDAVRFERDASADRVIDLESMVAGLEAQVKDLERDIEEFEKSQPDAGGVAAAFHDLMRDEGFVRDEARDVPFRVAPTTWRTKLEKTAEEALP